MRTVAAAAGDDGGHAGGGDDDLGRLLVVGHLGAVPHRVRQQGGRQRDVVHPCVVRREQRAEGGGPDPRVAPLQRRPVEPFGLEPQRALRPHLGLERRHLVGVEGDLDAAAAEVADVHAGAPAEFRHQFGIAAARGDGERQDGVVSQDFDLGRQHAGRRAGGLAAGHRAVHQQDAAPAGRQRTSHCGADDPAADHDAVIGGAHRGLLARNPVPRSFVRRLRTATGGV